MFICVHLVFTALFTRPDHWPSQYPHLSVYTLYSLCFSQGPPRTLTCLCSPCVHYLVHKARSLTLPVPSLVCIHLVFTVLFTGHSQYPHLSVFTLCSLPCSQGPNTGSPSTHTCLCSPCVHCLFHRAPNTGPPSTHTCLCSLCCSQGPPSTLTCLCSPCVHCLVHRARSLALRVPTPLCVRLVFTSLFTGPNNWPSQYPHLSVFTLCSLPCSQGPNTGPPSTRFVAERSSHQSTSVRSLASTTQRCPTSG